MKPMKYRKKAIVIEAFQWFPSLGDCGGVITGASGNAYLKTNEGYLMVSPGDWIIAGVEGEKYPCKPSIFTKTYESIRPKKRRDYADRMPMFKRHYTFDTLNTFNLPIVRLMAAEWWGIDIEGMTKLSLIEAIQLKQEEVLA